MATTDTANSTSRPATRSRTRTVTVLSVEARTAKGKAVRATMPRTAHAEWTPHRRAHQPLDLLAEQAETRVPELVPIRHGRMAASPFAYFRGAALPMAADLAAGPNTGLIVQLCGDAHLSNFGGFASPERELVFDVNDFDETAPGPFEWDLKRLAASFEIAGRSRAFEPKTLRLIVAGTVRSYQEAIRAFAAMPNLQVWYAHLDATEMLQRWGGTVARKTVLQVERNVSRAQTKDQIKARARLTRLVDGELRFLSDPPLLVPVDELYGEAEGRSIRDWIHQAIRGYRRSLQGDRRRLLESYRFVDLARKVVGVGSVGTRAWVALFVGRDNSDTLILQAKEAEASVLERFAAKSVFDNHGQRVVEGQRLMQASSDIFLGWHRVSQGVDGRPHDYYFRQLWDWKLSPAIETMEPELLGAYGKLCGWTLARGHARSGDAIAISSYLGAGDTFPLALADFASSYADQNAVDHEGLVEAIASGTVSARAEV